MPYTAKHRFAPMSSKKLHPVAKLIRGKSVEIALETLKYLPNRGARLIEKVIRSAQANAEDRGFRHPEDLMIQEVRIDGAGMMKRILPGCRGMAHVLHLRQCHITVNLEDPDVLFGDEQTGEQAEE
jgi:large subunit ribosomal protein L22